MIGLNEGRMACGGGVRNRHLLRKPSITQHSTAFFFYQISTSMLHSAYVFSSYPYVRVRVHARAFYIRRCQCMKCFRMLDISLSREHTLPGCVRCCKVSSTKNRTHTIDFNDMYCHHRLEYGSSRNPDIADYRKHQC